MTVKLSLKIVAFWFNSTLDEAGMTELLCNFYLFFQIIGSHATVRAIWRYLLWTGESCFFRDIERGDIVIGRISSIREFGFFMVLLFSRHYEIYPT